MKPITLVDPKVLRPHPANIAIPRLTQGMPEWLALRDDVEERGIREPLQIHRHQVVDGETRRGVALSLGLEAVPCVELDEDEVLTTIRQHLILQKHLTKGQRAYILMPHMQATAEELRARSTANLRKGHSPVPTESAPGNIGIFENFCRANGFSRDLGEQARTLHALFDGDRKTLAERNLDRADPAQLRATWEPRILDLDNPVGLGAALAGMAGELATKDKEKTPNGDIQLELFTEGAGAMDRVAKAWPKMRTADRPKIVQAWKRLTLAWPEEMRRELATALLDGMDSK